MTLLLIKEFNKIFDTFISVWRSCRFNILNITLGQYQFYLHTSITYHFVQLIGLTLQLYSWPFIPRVLHLQILPIVDQKYLEKNYRKF